MRRLVLASLFVLPLALNSCAGLPGVSGVQAAPKLTGEWSVSRSDNTQFEIQIFEDNGKITGKTVNETSPKSLDGLRQDDQVKFTIVFSESYSMVYTGKIASGGDKLEGSVKSIGSPVATSEQTFTASKKSTL